MELITGRKRKNSEDGRYEIGTRSPKEHDHIPVDRDMSGVKIESHELRTVRYLK